MHFYFVFTKKFINPLMPNTFQWIWKSSIFIVSGSISHSWLVTMTGLWLVTWRWKKLHVDDRQVFFGILRHLSLSYDTSTTFPTKPCSINKINCIFSWYSFERNYSTKRQVHLWTLWIYNQIWLAPPYWI